MMILTTGLAVFFTFLEMISRLLWLNNKTILMLEEIIWKSKADLDHRACCRLTQSCSRRWSQRDWMRLFSTHCKSKAAMMSHQMNRPNANLWEWRLLFSKPADVSAGKVIWIVKIVANSHLKVIWSSGARDIQSYDTKKDIFYHSTGNSEFLVFLYFVLIIGVLCRQNIAGCCYDFDTNGELSLGS